MRRKGEFWEYLLAHPWALILFVLALVVIAVFWFWDQMNESKASDQLHEDERKRSDSIWKE